MCGISRIVLWLALTFACFLPVSALPTSAPEMGCTVLVHNTDPSSIYFSRDPAAIQATDTFAHGPWAGRTLGEAVNEASALGKLPEGLTLNASWVNDSMVAANNGTLWVAQQAGLQMYR